jgi:hypothetical protein
VADLIEYGLDDGTTVLFEAAEAELVGLRGNRASVEEGGGLLARVNTIAKAAQRIGTSMRDSLEPDELTLELGIRISGELNAWFFAKNQAEATIKVTASWKQGR